ncbi:MAG: hypothetical protein WBR18_11965 [Anaerolineales bacterium]
MLSRLGSALILIGVILMVVYLVTATVGQSDFRLLLSGFGAAALGLFFHRRGSTPVEGARFQGLRRLLGEDEEPDA